MLIVLLTTCVVILACVALHYAALGRLTVFIDRHTGPPRRWVAFSVLGMLIVHVVEVTLFAVGYWAMAHAGEFGKLVGAVTDSISDYWYFSFNAYTSLGFGDITPEGDLRLMTALETLTGLILIAWSASFLYMQMNRLWDRRH